MVFEEAMVAFHPCEIHQKHFLIKRKLVAHA